MITKREALIILLLVVVAFCLAFMIFSTDAHSVTPPTTTTEPTFNCAALGCPDNPPDPVTSTTTTTQPAPPTTTTVPPSPSVAPPVDTSGPVAIGTPASVVRAPVPLRGAPRFTG